MSFLTQFLKALAPKFEQKATRTLVESQAFKRVVHTVEKEGLKGVHAHVKNSKAGFFATALYDELRKDLGLEKTKKQEPESWKRLTKKS